LQKLTLFSKADKYRAKPGAVILKPVAKKINLWYYMNEVIYSNIRLLTGERGAPDG